MAKIGRNDPCPCGSGKKFKRCCLPAKRISPPPATPPSLNQEVAKLQEEAANRKETFKTMGVFILFSTKDGDGWLLEVTEKDGIKVAEQGERLPVGIKESPETIEIDWTHKYAVRNKGFVVTSYKDKTETRFDHYPTQRISAAEKKILKKIPAELLEAIHVAEEEPQQPGT